MFSFWSYWTLGQINNLDLKVDVIKINIKVFSPKKVINHRFLGLEKCWIKTIIHKKRLRIKYNH